VNKILLVGELNPYGADPEYALYPLPAHASGNRLKEILGLTLREYLKEHDRVNLCTGSWSAKAAKLRAFELLEVREPGTGLVLCGSKVAYAFNQTYPGGFLHRTARGLFVLVIPHPSGRNRVWNDPAAAADVRERYAALRGVVGVGNVT
jgi:hypothetical protein